MIDNTYRLKVCVCGLKQEKMVCMKRYWILDLAWSSFKFCVLEENVLLYLPYHCYCGTYLPFVQNLKKVCIRYKKIVFFCFFPDFVFLTRSKQNDPIKESIIPVVYFHQRAPLQTYRYIALLFQKTINHRNCCIRLDWIGERARLEI